MRRVTAPAESIATIGAGTSTLISELLAAGYRSITAVDISQTALARLGANLGDDSAHVRFIRADARSVLFPTAIDVWHDRATFLFLTDGADQAAYVRAVAAAVRPGGHLVIATFAERGPEQCSGLPVARHSAGSLESVFGSGFDLIESFEREHLTPWGATQWFTHAVMRSHSRSEIE